MLLPQIWPDILGHRALPTGRIAALGARRNFRHGLFTAGEGAACAPSCSDLHNRTPGTALRRDPPASSGPFPRAGGVVLAFAQRDPRRRRCRRHRGLGNVRVRCGVPVGVLAAGHREWRDRARRHLDRPVTCPSPGRSRTGHSRHRRDRAARPAVAADDRVDQSGNTWRARSVRRRVCDKPARPPFPVPTRRRRCARRIRCRSTQVGP